MRALGPALLLVLVVPAGAAEAEAPCADAPDPACADSEARRLLEAGEARPAIELLKPALRRFPDSGPLVLLLARAYLAAGNHFWAARTLQRRVAARPEECAAVSWLAWIQLRQGFLDQAEQALDVPRCEREGPAAARWAVLRTLLARYREDEPAALAALEAGRSLPEAWPDDAEALRVLAGQVDPGYSPPVRARLELDGGWTANARAGAPSDPDQGGDHGSPAGLARAALEVRWPVDSVVQPVVEARVWGVGYGAESERDLSYVLASARPGLRLDLALPVLVAYRYDVFGLAGADEYVPGPHIYFQSHRGELDLELTRSLQLLLGAGHRTFRQRGRTRVEADAMLLGHLPALGRLRPAATLQGRWHDALGFGRQGVTGLLSGQVLLGGGWSTRLSVLASWDLYSRSAAFFSETGDREDRLLRGVAVAWSPRRAGVRVGAGVEAARRWSTVDDYSFTDARLLLKVAWAASSDPWLPEARDAPGHVPLAYGLTAAETDDADSVRELLRQDEAAISGSACVE